jgi:hypothetical protein
MMFNFTGLSFLAHVGEGRGISMGNFLIICNRACPKVMGAPGSCRCFTIPDALPSAFRAWRTAHSGCNAGTTARG